MNRNLTKLFVTASFILCMCIGLLIGAEVSSGIQSASTLLWVIVGAASGSMVTAGIVTLEEEKLKMDERRKMTEEHPVDESVGT